MGSVPSPRKRNNILCEGAGEEGGEGGGRGEKEEQSPSSSAPIALLSVTLYCGRRTFA